MKAPTMSKDGRKRATIAVSFRIGEEDLTAAICYLLDNDKKVTRKTVEDCLRTLLSTTGTDFHELHAIEDATIRHWDDAKALTLKLFPEFVDNT